MSSLLDAMTRRRPRPLSNLAREDRVVLFPSVGYLSRDRGHWIVDVHGDISRAGQMSLGKRVLLKLFKRAMRATDEEVATPLFHERIDRFIAQDRRGVRIAVRIGDQVYGLPKKSRPNGQFQGAVRVPVSQVGPEDQSGLGDEDCLSVEVCGARTSGRVHLLKPTGLSVISDIDDTLKHSHVACKRTLLTNTFLRPFEAIPGMAPLFRQWWADGASFHYVSSSPWQLYEHLSEHLASEGFPPGSFHLRPFRLRDHLLRRILMLRRSGKLAVIRALLRTFPQRKFVLVGDSGEHDPEIYGTLARRFPQQVIGLFIRQLTDRRSMAKRYRRAFRGINPALYRLYEDADELTEVQLPS